MRCYMIMNTLVVLFFIFSKYIGNHIRTVVVPVHVAANHLRMPTTKQFNNDCHSYRSEFDSYDCYFYLRW